MKRLIAVCLCCAALLLCALPVCAEEGQQATPTTTTTTAATTTTTTTAAPTTTVTTTTAATTTAVQTTTAATKVPTTTAATKAPVTTTQASGTTTQGATTTVTTAATTAPVIVDPTLVERAVLVSEPGMSDDTVFYFNGENQMKHDDMLWVPGRNGGQALNLTGSNEYLRYSTTQTKALTAFTFSGWVYWRGGAAGQKLLTVYKNDNIFFTVSPNWQEAERDIDGFYLEVRDRTIDAQASYYPVSDGQNTRLEVNAWHHVAVVVTETAFRLYVDGTEYLSTEYQLSMKDMGLTYFKIGGGFHNEPMLNALLDDAYLYPRELTAEHIALLAADMDPAAGGTPPTEAPYLPTRPTTVVNKKPSDGHTPSRPTVFGIPLLMVLIPVGILVAVIALSLVFSAQKKNAEAAAEEADDDARPVLGEPEMPIDAEELPEWEELPELEELPALEELPELEDLPEIEEIVEPEVEQE